jgi:hypothetical protein
MLPSPNSAGPTPLSPAQALPPAARQQRALDALAGYTITELACQHDVRRKFVYQQREKDEQAIAQAFTPAPASHDRVLSLCP